MDKIEQICDATAYALNVLTGLYSNQSVFKITYTNGNHISWNGTDKTYPDQIKCFPNTDFRSSSSTLLLENEADYDRIYSASMNAEFSGIAFSATASSSFLYHGNLFTQSSTTYGVDYKIQRLCYFNRSNNLIKDGLEADFIAAINSLPTDISTKSNQDQYEQFFNAYGTHFITMGSIGGSYYMETAISDSVFKSKTDLEIKTAVSLGYQGLVRSGKFSAEAAYNSSDFLKQHRNEINISIAVLGGTYFDGGDISAWVTSLYSTPSVILGVPSSMDTLGSKLSCISNLSAIAGASSTIKQNIETMIKRLSSASLDGDGLITHARSVAANAVINSNHGCGFLSTSVVATNNGDRGLMRAFIGNNIDPQQEIGAASQHYYTGSDTWVPCNSLLAPIPNNSNYKIFTQTTSGAPNYIINYIGIGTTDIPALENFTSLALNNKITAPSDGFVIGYLETTANGDRAFLTGVVNGATIAGCSIHQYDGNDHYIPCNSFTIPVRKGDVYQIQFTPTCNNPKAAANFIPITSGVATLQAQQALSSGTNYTATSDGFVVAFLSANNNGERGQLLLQSQPNGATANALTSTARASVHSYSGSDMWIRYDTATLPVSKGDTFSCTYLPTSGYPTLSLYWVGLQATPSKAISMIATGLTDVFNSAEPSQDPSHNRRGAANKVLTPAS